jgi:hypothetical protein
MKETDRQPESMDFYETYTRCNGLLSVLSEIGAEGELLFAEDRTPYIRILDLPEALYDEDIYDADMISSQIFLGEESAGGYVLNLRYLPLTEETEETKETEEPEKIEEAEETETAGESWLLEVRCKQIMDAKEAPEDLFSDEEAVSMMYPETGGLKKADHYGRILEQAEQWSEIQPDPSPAGGHSR